MNNVFFVFLSLSHPGLGVVLDCFAFCLTYNFALKLYLLVSTADNFSKQFGPRSGPTKCLTLDGFLKEIFKKVDFEQKSADDKKEWEIIQY